MVKKSDNQRRAENVTPGYYDEIAENFARRIKILLSHCPINHRAVHESVEWFIRDLTEFEAQGIPLQATDFDRNYVGYLIKAGIETDRQLSKLTFDQLVSLYNNRSFATGVRKEMIRLQIPINSVTNIESRGGRKLKNS